MPLHSLTEISQRVDDPETVVTVLKSIGLPLPFAGTGRLSASTEIAEAVRLGTTLRVHQVDAALANTELPIGDRIAFKTALVRCGLMRSAA